MCGIFGYIGRESIASKILLSGLKRLEYRGYDSWGIAVGNHNRIYISKNIGPVSHAASLTLPPSHIGIAHTRWATTGGVTITNSHPHISTDGTFCLVQNGIVENFLDLKQFLTRNNYHFVSETDTEVIVRLIEYEFDISRNFKAALKSAFSRLTGRNTIAILHYPDSVIYAIRNGSPLVVGQNQTKNQTFLSSDTLSLAKFAKEFSPVGNGQIVILKKNSPPQLEYLDSDFTSPIHFQTLHIPDPKISKSGFPHFMLKEIFDTPAALNRLAHSDTALLDQLASKIKTSRRIFTIGSGTAGMASLQIAGFLTEIAGIPTTHLIGADAGGYYPYFDSQTVIIAPSQSGETADVLEVLEIAKSRHSVIASFVNMPGSRMSSLSDYSFPALSGPEIGVASTKVFSSQICWGYLLAHTIAGNHSFALKQVVSASRQINSFLQNPKSHLPVRRLAQKLKFSPLILLLGQHESFPIIGEGMIKIIETSYLHAHALPAGDLKHYAITLIEPQSPVILTFPSANNPGLLNVASEVKARGAYVIGLSPVNHPIFDFHLPTPGNFPLTAVVSLQLLAYYLGISLHRPIDRPRNIAKSVTVK